MRSIQSLKNYTHSGIARSNLLQYPAVTHTEAIRTGFRLVHRNWQLILIQFVMSVLGCAAFLLFLGVPLVVAFLMLGIDLAELVAFRDLLDTLREPGELVGRYLGVALVIAASLLLYLAFVFFLWVYVAGGSAGVIGASLRDPTARFTLRGFLSEGRKLFFPFACYALVMGLMLLGAFFFLGALGGALSMGLSALSGDTALGFFFRVLTALVFLSAGGLLVFALSAVGVTGVPALVLDRAGTLKTLRTAYAHLNAHPGALGLYAIVLAGYLAVSVVLALLGYPLQLLPLVGVFLSVPYQLVSYVIQGYFCLVMLAAVFAHYVGTTAGESTAWSGTSGEAPRPASPLARSAGPQ